MGRERSHFSRISGVKDPSLIVIATEGQKDEQQYFEAVRTKCESLAGLFVDEEGAGVDSDLVCSIR